MINIKKYSKNVAVLIALMATIARRCSKNEVDNLNKIVTSHDATKFVKHLFIGKLKEEFYVISLDSQNIVKTTSLISKGTVNETAVSLREVVEVAIITQAVSIILTHNHPSATCQPSEADISLTKKIIAILMQLNIKVLDHIIFCNYNCYSFKKNGKL